MIWKAYSVGESLTHTKQQNEYKEEHARDREGFETEFRPQVVVKLICCESPSTIPAVVGGIGSGTECRHERKHNACKNKSGWYQNR
jgi:hypothetical protein